jgi:hypothetical protein
MESQLAVQVKELVAKNYTSDSLALLLEQSKSNKQIHDAIHIVLGEFNDLTAQQLKGTIDNIEATRRRNIIHDKILISLNSFDSQGKPLPSSVIAQSSRTTKFLLRLGSSILAIALLIALVAYITYLKTPNSDSVIVYGLVAYFIGIGGLIILGGWFLALFVNALKGR